MFSSLQGHVRIDPAKAEPAHAGTHWRFVRPRLASRIIRNAGRLCAEFGMRSLATGGGREHLGMHGHRCFDQAGHSGRRFGMSDIGFHRSDRCGWRVIAGLTSRLGERL